MLSAPTLLFVLAGSPFAYVAIHAGVTALSLAYTIGMHATRGQTLGKMAVGIKVLKSSGEPIELGTAVLRYAVDIFLSIAVLVLVTQFVLQVDPAVFQGDWKSKFQSVTPQSAAYRVVQVMSMLWTLGELICVLATKRRQALHDLIAGTIVVNLRPVESRVNPSS